MAQEIQEVEELLRRQDEAMALLDRLRLAEPLGPGHEDTLGGGRRDFRRWPAPNALSIELHDGEGWKRVNCIDIGIGGARLSNSPEWVDGPLPVRLKTPKAAPVLALSDVMWRDRKAGIAGIHFEFRDGEERDNWASTLIDALLSRYSLT
jgi:hypothetical protein